MMAFRLLALLYVLLAGILWAGGYQADALVATLLGIFASSRDRPYGKARS